MASIATIVLLVRAENDLLRFYADYESYTAGRGEEFSREAEQLLTLLAHWPRLGRNVGKEYRRLKMSGFPCSLIYKVEGRRIVVHTVISNHASLEAILRSLQN